MLLWRTELSILIYYLFWFWTAMSADDSCSANMPKLIQLNTNLPYYFCPVFATYTLSERLVWSTPEFWVKREDKICFLFLNKLFGCIIDFLLVINSNFGPILHRFWDKASYWLKIANLQSVPKEWFGLYSAGTDFIRPTCGTDSGGSRKKYLGGLAPHHLGGNNG